MTRRRVAAALSALVVLVAAPTPAVGADPAGTGRAGADRLARDSEAGGQVWRALLERAATSTGERAFRGEMVWVTRTPDGPRRSTVEVRGGTGRLDVNATDRLTMRLGALGSHVVHHEQGWFAPLPAAGRRDLDGALDALAGKYHVEVGGWRRVADRRCRRVDFRRRSDGRLTERLWLDVVTGLVLRRETFGASGGRLRTATYRDLDLSPVTSERRDPQERAASLERRTREVQPVSDRRLAALRSVGYALPERLPAGYRRAGVYAATGPGGASLQAVYRDGLYTVSVFQQRGRPDRAALPDGAVETALVGWQAYEWPGAVPQRLLWEASGTTFLLVGDAPPDDLAALARALPRPSAQRSLDRLRRGLSRLWSVMSPWE